MKVSTSPSGLRIGLSLHHQRVEASHAIHEPEALIVHTVLTQEIALPDRVVGLVDQSRDPSRYLGLLAGSEDIVGDGNEALFFAEFLPAGAEARVDLIICVGTGGLRNLFGECTAVGGIKRGVKFHCLVGVRPDKCQPLRLPGCCFDDLRLVRQEVPGKEVE